MENKTAVLFGATGLVGQKLLQQLLQDKAYQKIVVFARHKINIQHNKLQLIITDFQDEKFLSQNLFGDVLFCCLGTTIKKAGSQAAFRKVDYELPVLLAQIASKNKFSSFLVISSIGANASSKNFYLRTKGEMEQAVLAIPFKTTIIVRPSLLLGKRKEVRTGESLGKILSTIASPIFIGPLRAYKPIHSHDVAVAMVHLSHEESIKKIVESSELQKIAKMPFLECSEC